MPTSTTVAGSILSSGLNPYNNIKVSDGQGFGMRSEIVLPPKATIRVGGTTVSTEELEMFVRIARKLVIDQYPEDLL